jgi:hypothetical protein
MFYKHLYVHVRVRVCECNLVVCTARAHLYTSLHQVIVCIIIIFLV